MPRSDKNEPFVYEGFLAPNTTPVPDDVFDIIAPELTEAELRVLLYVVRRTFGFKKQSDAISAAQMVSGIKTRDGRQLDRGTGMAKSAVWRGIQGLITKGILIKRTTMSEQGDNEVNIYSLHFRSDGVVLQEDHPRPQKGVVLQEDYRSPRREPPVVLQKDPQETDSQETVKQDTDQDSSSLRKTSTQKKQIYDEVRLTLIEFVSDLAAEFIDTASVASSTTRAVNLFRSSGTTLDTFIDIMTEARAITKERMASIKKKNHEGDKSKMAYFFAVLEDRLSLEQQNGHPS